MFVLHVGNGKVWSQTLLGKRYPLSLCPLVCPFAGEPAHPPLSPLAAASFPMAPQQSLNSFPAAAAFDASYLDVSYMQCVYITIVLLILHLVIVTVGSLCRNPADLRGGVSLFKRQRL